VITYKYKAIDATGRKYFGRMDASNPAELELYLGKMDLDLICLSKQKNSFFSITKRKISRQELIVFSCHLEQLVRAGVPLFDGLRDLRDSVENLLFKEVISALVEAVEGGKTLSESLAQFPNIFDTVFVNLIRAGEESGMLEDVLKNIIKSLKWQDELVAQTKKIILYPAFVGVIVVGVIFFLLIYLVPKLVIFISGMGGEIPVYTQILIYVSDFVRGYWYFLIAVPVGIVFFIKYLICTSSVARYRFDGYKLKIWLIGPVLHKIILARFVRCFALLYSSGITVLNCIEINEAISGNVVMQNALRQVREEIADGNNISDSIASMPLFSPLVLRMIKVGETTGELESALGNVSYFYDREIKENVERIQLLIEPILTVVLGIILGWVMLSVLGPIYDVVSKV